MIYVRKTAERRAKRQPKEPAKTSEKSTGFRAFQQSQDSGTRAFLGEIFLGKIYLLFNKL
jgi:hypothetical protein